MPYYCNACGNYETFKGYQDYTARGSCRVYMDAEGSVDDYGDENEHDRESGDIEEVECHECDSDDVTWMDDDEWQEAVDRGTTRPSKTATSVANWKSRIEQVP